MARITEKEIADQLAARLKRENIPFAREVPIGGVHVDFAFWAPNKQMIVAELKGWEPSHENLDRAVRQAELYKQRTGAAAAYVVVPGLERGQIEHGLVSEDELVSLLAEKYRGAIAKQPARRAALHVVPKSGQWVVRSSGTGRKVSAHGTKAEAVEAGRLIARSARADIVIHSREGRITARDSYGRDVMPPKDKKAARSPHARKRPVVAYKRGVGKVGAAKKSRSGVRSSPNANPKKIFAAMPFSREYDDVYFVAMAPAAEKTGAVCDRVDHQAYSGDVVEEIKKMIRASSAVIADFSESRPNVLYEVGYAEALGIPTIHICSTPLDKLPFDVRNHRTIPYTKGQTHKLGGVLARELTSILP